MSRLSDSSGTSAGFETLALGMPPVIVGPEKPPTLMAARNWSYWARAIVLLYERRPLIDSVNPMSKSRLGNT
jgi:hypothetical protein